MGPISAMGQELQRSDRAKYGYDEPYFLTGVWHEMLTLDPVDAVGIAEELLRRAKVRLPVVDAEARVYDSNAKTAEEGLRLAHAVLGWARKPQEHGGNPYLMEHVDMARDMLGDKAGE